MVLDAGPVAGGVGGVRGRVIEAAGFQPVAAAFVLLSQDRGTDVEVAIGVEGPRRVLETSLVPAPVDLHESYIDVPLPGREVALQGVQRLPVRAVSLRPSTHVEGPGPRPRRTRGQPCAGLGGGEGVQDIGRNTLGLSDAVVAFRNAGYRLGRER